MNSAVAELMYGSGGVSRDFIKESLKELFLEEPELLNNELQEVISELSELINNLKI